MRIAAGDDSTQLGLAVDCKDCVRLRTSDDRACWAAMAASRERACAGVRCGMCTEIDCRSASLALASSEALAMSWKPTSMWFGEQSVGSVSPAFAIELSRTVSLV